MPSISQLDFDILNCLADFLEAHDLLSLCLTCKSLYRNVLERPPSNLDFCEKTLRNCAPYSWEYLSTRSRRFNTTEDRKRAFREVFRRYCARITAFALGKPAAAYVLSSDTPSDVVYGDGAVAYTVDGLLQFLDLRSTGRRGCIPLKEISNSIRGDCLLRDCELLWLREEIVVLNVFVDHFSLSPDRPFLLAIDFSNPFAPRSCMDAILIDSSMKFFVRHNRDYLYWGTHSGSSVTHDHHEWTVQGIALSHTAKFDPLCASSESKGRKSLPMQLTDIPGSNVGSDIDFRIHKDHFYAVSNCEFELAEIDWTSFYHCIKFPLNRPEPAATQKKHRVYRRQHDDGVIQDGWINLSLQVDEKTDEVLIVEALNEFRTVYQPDVPRHARTWYTTRIDFDEDDQDLDFIPPLGPENDPLIQLRDPNSNYAPKQHRDSWQTHSEVNHQEYRSSLPQLKYMKSMSYSLNTQSFLDILVKLDCPCQLDGYCLQFRSGHRWLHSVTSPGNIPPNPTVYRYNRIRAWPPPASQSQYAETAHTAMNLSNHNGDVVFGWPMRIIGDERFLLILLRGYKDRKKDRLLLFSFDKFAPITLFNSLGREDLPASKNYGCIEPKVAVRNSESPSPSVLSTMELEDIEQETIDAEDMDIEDVLLEGGWS